MSKRQSIENKEKTLHEYQGNLGTHKRIATKDFLKQSVTKHGIRLLFSMVCI